MEASLYERIGGNDAVDATVTKLYEKIIADRSLARFFSETDMAKMHRSQSAFITFAFGGPNHYTGKSMRVVHKKAVSEGLSDEHFDAVARHLKTSMQELNVPSDLIDEAMAIVSSTRADVLNQ